MAAAEPQADPARKPCPRGKHGKAKTDGADGWRCPTCGAKLCGAKLRKKPGRRCSQDKLMPNGRCRIHGGKTPSGPASANWRTGRRSKHRWMGSLPTESLGKRFNDALADPTLTSLRAAMALNDAMLTSYTNSLKDTGRPLTMTQQERVHKLIAMQGNLAEKEARRLRDLGTMVTQAQFMVVVNTCIALFTEFVTDVKARQDVHRRLQQALMTTGRPADTIIDSD